MNDLKKGDFIKCKDKDDMVDTFMNLMKYDIETDFVYERNGQKGLWLEVVNIGQKRI